MATNPYKLVPLQATTTIKPFKSTDSDLNGFLFDSAKNYMEELLAVTYLLEDLPNNKTAAYFSLLNDKIAYDEEERPIWNKLNRQIPNAKRWRHYPAVKIGRLAISEEYMRKGLGRDIIFLIKLMFINESRAGCRFLTVDAYQEAIGFYQKCGFDFMSKKDSDEITRSMFYDLKTYKGK